MNKVLVTGLALGREIDVCQVCNFDFTWLVKYPSVLLWSDKILITDNILKTIFNNMSDPSRAELNKSLKIIFEMLQSTSLIEVVNPTSVITPVIKSLIFKELTQDRERLPKYFPDEIKTGDDDKMPGHLIINNQEYCDPYLLTIYLALLLSKFWRAESLFDSQVFNFLRYKFLTVKGLNKKSESFHKISETFLPNVPILPEYVVEQSFVKKSRCNECVKIKKCKDSYLLQLEENMKEIMQWRNYDEIQQMKIVINKIIATKEKMGITIDPNEIKAEFKDEIYKVQKRIKKIFPKVTRWSNLVTILSIPVAITGLATDVLPATIAGATLAGISHTTKEIIDFMKSKYNWLGFINTQNHLSKFKSQASHRKLI